MACELEAVTIPEIVNADGKKVTAEFLVRWECSCGRRGQRSSFSSGAPVPQTERALRGIGRRAWRDHAERMTASS